MNELFLMLTLIFFIKGLKTETEKDYMCKKLEFQCALGYCIPYHLTCDGNIDCFDESDEDEKWCHTRRCPPGMPYRCRIIGRCIPASWLCDGETDCPGGSDEKKKICKKKKKRLLKIQKEYEDEYGLDIESTTDYY